MQLSDPPEQARRPLPARPSSTWFRWVAAASAGAWILAGDWVAAVGILVLCIGWRYLRGTEGPPVLAMAFTFQWAQVTAGVYYSALTRRPLNTMELSDYRPMVLIGLGCLVALLAGLALGMKVVRPARLESGARLGATFSWPTLLTVYVAAMVVTETLQSFAWEVPSLTQAILALTYARLAALCMIFRRLTYPRVRWGWMGALLLFEIPLGFTGFFAGFREPIMLAAVALLAVFDSRKVRHWLILGALVIAMFFTGVLWMAIRTDFRQDFESQVFAESREARLKRISALTSGWLSRNYAERLEDVDAFVDRMWVVYYPALAVSRVPSVVPHADGSILWGALLNLVTPRLLFPDKAVLPSDSDMVLRYSGVWVAGPEEGTSIAFGYAAESYVDFGLPLMFLPVFVYGFLMGMAYHFWLRIVRRRDLAVGLVTVIFWLSLYIFERSWIKTLGLTVTMMVYLGGATILIDRLLFTGRARVRRAVHRRPLGRAAR